MSRFRNFMSAIGDKISGVVSRISPTGRLRIVVVFFIVVISAWCGAMVMTHKIDDNVNFGVTEGEHKGGSYAVAVTADLINREVNVNPWTANAPFFTPSHYLDNMPNFQQGIIYALSRFTVQMSDQIGRARGSSQVDPDLDRAVGLLKYPGNVWVYDLKTSLLPTASSETQYRRAREALLSYNTRLAQGKAVFDPRSDNLVATLDGIAGDIGSQSAIIEQYIRENHFWLTEGRSDDIFYSTKGRLYAYYVLLRELEKDYADVIKERDLTTVWDNMLLSFREAVELDPVIIVDGKPDSQLMPSHLVSQGFYLLRARTNLREITGVLTR